MKTFAVTVFLFLSFFGFANIQQNGLILPKNYNDNNFDNYCCVFAPTNGFNLYDAPNGNIIGKVLQKQNPNLANTQQHVIALLNGNSYIFKNFNKGLTEVGYELFAMSSFKVKDGFVKIFDKKSAYWLKISEIEKDDFKVSNWQDFLVENNDKLLGYYAKKPGLNLREAPSKNARVLKTLRGNLFEIRLQKEVKGYWNKVKVIKYQEHPCKGDLTKEENIEYILNGWIKTVDDDGTPNVWYYPRGC